MKSSFLGPSASQVETKEVATQGQVLSARLSGMGDKIQGRLAASGTQESYRQGIFFLFRVNLLLGCLTLGVLLAFLYAIARDNSHDRYYAMFFDGSKTRMHSFQTPSLSKNSLLLWAADAAVDIMTFGFNDYNVRIGRARKYFTDLGWASFKGAMASSEILANVKKNQQLLTAISDNIPVIEYEGLRNGKYVWDVRVPIILTLRAGSSSLTATPTLLVTVVKVPTSQNPRGLGIEQWRMY